MDFTKFLLPELLSIIGGYLDNISRICMQMALGYRDENGYRNEPRTFEDSEVIPELFRYQASLFRRFERYISVDIITQLKYLGMNAFSLEVIQSHQKRFLFWRSQHKEAVLEGCCATDNNMILNRFYSEGTGLAANYKNEIILGLKLINLCCAHSASKCFGILLKGVLSLEESILALNIPIIFGWCVKKGFVAGIELIHQEKMTKYIPAKLQEEFCGTAIERKDFATLNVLRRTVGLDLYSNDNLYNCALRAAKTGNLEIVKYCVEEGCPINCGYANICTASLANDSPECLEYGLEKGIILNNQFYAALRHARAPRCQNYLATKS